MCRVPWSRTGPQKIILATLCAAFLYLLAVLFMEGQLSRRSATLGTGAGRNSLLGEWKWGNDAGLSQGEADDPFAEGGDVGALRETRQRYQAEVEELKTIAQSLREEIRAKNLQLTALTNGNSPEDGETKVKSAHSHRHGHRQLSLREAGAIAERAPKEGDGEYDLQCPQLVDDAYKLSSPVKPPSPPSVPKIMPPPESLAVYPMPKVDLSQRCTMSKCLDMSRCSLTRPSAVFVYNETLPSNQPSKTPANIDALHRSVHQGIRRSGYWTADAREACLFVVVLQSIHSDPVKVSSFLKHLQYWRGDGRNHVIIDSPDVTMTSSSSADLAKSHVTYEYGNAILASPYSGYGFWRRDYDLFMTLPVESASPKATGLDGAQHQYRLLPAYRPVLLQFSAFEHTSTKSKTDGDKSGEVEGHTVTSGDLTQLQKSAGRKVDLQLECSSSLKHASLVNEAVAKPGWYLCGNEQDQAKRIITATFTLVVEPLTNSLLQAQQFLGSLLQCMRLGSIPVILRTQSYALPFEEILDWQKAAVMVPAARVTELDFIIANIDEDDVLSRKQQGHFLWETYFSGPEAVAMTLVNVIRRRIGMPAHPLQSVSLHKLLEKPAPSSYSPLPSPTFRQNFTYESAERWNSPPGGLFLPPLSPYVQHKPSGWEYIRQAGDARKLHPVIEAGGALWGENFQNYLSGSRDPERFTVVLLTYRRPLVLYNALQRLANMPRLDRVIVVWNDDVPPNDDVAWPALDVPLEVVKVERNSLNNRFLPLDSIQTEAVLSLDDDTHLRREEIDIAFRAWRENRHRLVGFPGRFHSWDSRHGGWAYNANYSCELSMVLTGAAFIHKFYLHMYSHFMDERIRAHVDKVMNCEDIAMNMLVSHYTRQPPIKVTLRWTFHCDGCTDALSDNTEHFNKRHQCMNYFSDVFGYMPLIKTQTRVDSVLFKTRLPRDKGKCYTFV